MSNSKARIVSGMRPTGSLHLGHYFGVLANWVQMQNEYECYFFVADWHALTTEYAKPKPIKGFVPELVKDWVAAGLDPEKCILFQQSLIKSHAELHLLLSMITPVGWLERNPTYKDLKNELAAKDLSTYGFLGYPVLQAADILLYKPVGVPVGQDQLPHLELTREIARRFNHLYGKTFPEPEARLTPSPKCPGLDGRKMSKSYGNAILLSEPMDQVKPKVMSMLTDVNRQRKSDPGDPDICNLFPYHEIMTPKEEQEKVRDGCTTATWGCVDCKKLLLKHMGEFLEPIHTRRAELDKNPARVKEILDAGNKRAIEESTNTMEEVRELIGFDF